MKATFFLQKGKHPPPPGAGAGAGAGPGAGAGAGAGAAHEKTAKIRIATFIFHWKLFPSCDTIRLKYKTKNNNINLSLINILYE